MSGVQVLMIESFPFNSFIEPVFFGVLTVWFVLTLAHLLDRTVFDLRFGKVVEARKLIEGALRAAEPVATRMETIDRLLSGLPTRVIIRMAADINLPPEVAEPFAHALERRMGIPKLLRAAASERGELGRWRRIAALRILSMVRPRDSYLLLEAALGDSDPEIAGAAVIILRQFGDLRSADLLIAALRSRSYSPSRIATHLDHIPLSIGDRLLPLLDDENATVRFWGATLLARYGDLPGLAPRLAALTADSDANVRKAAIQTLGKIGAPDAPEIALTLLGDPVHYVRAHAARAIGESRRHQLGHHIVPLLADRDFWVRSAAKEALVALGPEVWPDVAVALESPDRFARNGAAEVIQNLGVADQAVLGAGRPRSKRRKDADSLLRRLREAGGPWMFDALARRTYGPASVSTRRWLDDLRLPGPEKP